MMTNNYKPFVGGVPISIERLADSLRDLGHTVYIFAPDYKSPMDDDEYIFRFPTMKHKIAGAIPIPNLIYSYVKKTEGSGVGLYLTRMILERQGGLIRVESVPEKGSTFILQFRN